MVKLKKIELCDFRGFRGPDPIVIDLSENNKGKNLLLYGENGSGKSSLGSAIRDLLDEDNANDFDAFRNLYSFVLGADGSRSAPIYGHVRFHFDDGATPVLEWIPGSTAYQKHPLFQNLARTRGWMDYRLLWRCTDFGLQRNYAQVFEPLLRLVGGSELRSSRKKLGEIWKALKEKGTKPTKKGAPDNRPTARNKTVLGLFRGDVADFNVLLRAFVTGELEPKANAFLQRFTPWTTIKLTLEREASYGRVGKAPYGISAPWIAMRVHYKNDPQPLKELVGFLNEARITAVALSLYLAAISLAAPSSGFPQLLVLDDVLISLDMSHRRPLLELLQEEFGDWQVLLLTHDRAWYEVAKQKLKSGWKHWELFSIRIGDDERPLSKADKDHIDRAEDFLLAGEPKAAAVHLRTAFEEMLKVFCEELGIEVPYSINPREITLRALWDAVEHTEWKYTPTDKPCLDANGIARKWVTCAEQSVPLVPMKLSERLNLALSWVLNPLSHSESIDRYRDELFDAADCLRELRKHWEPIQRLGKQRYCAFLTQREKLMRLLKHRPVATTANG